MTGDVTLIEIRNEVLRKIGRNVVNFQKMEAMLKFLGAQMTISASSSELSKLVVQAQKAMSKRSMGFMVEAFLRAAYSSEQDVAKRTDSREARVHFTIRFEDEPAVAAEYKRALRSIVAERNKLIHKWLAAFDPNSVQSCEALSASLDEQHTKMWPEFEALVGIVTAVREVHNEVAQQLSSGTVL